MKISRNLNNAEIARLLRAVAAALEVKRANRFRVVAYDRAAVVIEHATSEAKDLWDDGKLVDLPGIGSNLAQHLDELFRTGKSRHFEQAMKGLPPAMFELLDISGIGAKTAYRLCKMLKLKNPKTVVDELIKAAKSGKIAPIEGFGEKSQRDILETAEGFKKGQVKKKRMLLPYADSVAKEIIAYLKVSSAVLRADPLGSLRRMTATVGDIDIAVATREPEETISWFVKYPRKKKIIERGPTGASLLLKSGHQVDLRVQKPEAYGSMLQYFIGSKHHNIHLRELAIKKRLSLSEHGIKPIGKIKKNDSFGMEKLKMKNYNSKLKIYEFSEEKNFYSILGLPWIPPEIREDTGEIEAALSGKLPKLIEIKDIKGDLHVHSDFHLESSHDEGSNSIEEMIEKALELGYEYLGFSEHNPSVSQHSEKEIIDLIKKKKNVIEQLRYSNNKNTQKVKKGIVKLINGLEIDIQPSGRLALPEKAFNFLDYAIVSVHSNFRMSRIAMTRRVLSALEHPKVKILGHPTGRKLGNREGFELDWDKVFAFCIKKGKYLEISAWPDRLDIPDSLVREAVKNGVKMVIDSDSHAIEHLSLMFYGVSVARRGWATPEDIINTLPYDKLSDILCLSYEGR